MARKIARYLHCFCSRPIYHIHAENWKSLLVETIGYFFICVHFLENNEAINISIKIIAASAGKLATLVVGYYLATLK